MWRGLLELPHYLTATRCCPPSFPIPTAPTGALAFPSQLLAMFSYPKATDTLYSSAEWADYPISKGSLPRLESSAPEPLLTYQTQELTATSPSKGQTLD